MKNAKEILASSLVLKAWEIIKSDLFAFIEKFVYIENMDTGQPVLFKLWPEQKRALQNIHDNRLTIVLKARQLGLTWLALAYALWCMLTRTGFRVTALSKKEDDALELVRRVKFILRNMPSYLIVEGKIEGILSWEGTTGRVTIYHPDGEDSVLQSFTAAADSGRSFTSSLVLIDEWAFQEYAEQIWTAAYPTVNRPGGGKVIGLSTGKRGSFFETMWNNAVSKANNFIPIFLNWRADPSRDDKWYEQTKKDLPNSYKQEYPSTMEEAFAIGQGAFFPEWNPEVHVIQDPTWYPPDECQIHGAYDAGFGSRACFKWYAVFPSGRAVAYREYYPQQVTDDMQAKKIKELSVRPDGTPEYLIEIRADPSCWNKQSGTGKSTAQVFAENGIYMLKADNDLKNGWRRLHQYLMPFQNKEGKLISVLGFTSNCANTIRTYPACEQAKDNPEDINKNSEHHCFVKGTLITTIKGDRPIEAVKAGDFVLTREGYKEVIASGATAKTKIYKAIFSNGKSLTGTYSHPIATKDGRWVAMGDLSVNDDVILRRGYAQIQIIDYMGIDTVYNLTVDGCPEYFANGILVHNCQDVDRYFCMHRPETIDYDAIMAGGFPSYYRGSTYDDDDDDESEGQITFYGY